MKSIKRAVRRLALSLLCAATLAAALTVARADPAAAAPGPFRPLSPARIMDTRLGLGGAVLGEREVRPLRVAGTAGVPSDAVAVALNVTATEPSVGGFLTVWPAGATQPETSNLNFLARQTVPNMVVVGIGAGGSINVANALGTTHAVVDVMGYFERGFTGIAPARLMDTRIGLGGTHLDAGDTRGLAIAGLAGVPSNAVAVALNVTVTNPTDDGFVTVWPGGTDRPGSSNVNMTAKQTVPNMVLVGLGGGGRINVYNNAGRTDVLVDVMGWFSAGGGFTGITPQRALDTRGSSCGIRLDEGETRTITLAGTAGVPGTAIGAVALNVTATNPSTSSYLTVWPAGQPRPNTSNLNVTAAQTVPNMVTVGVGVAGQVSIFNANGTVDVIVDVMGYFDGDTPGGTPIACPPVIASFGDGTHRVGTEVKTGRYVTTVAPNISCYWARLRGFSGALADVITNDIGSGQRIVDIKPSDAGFESSRCGTWRTFVASRYTPATTFTDGIWAVGSQVLPGRYLASGTTNCYWARTRGFSGESAETIANDIGSGNRILDIAAGDVGVESSRCGTWTRLE